MKLHPRLGGNDDSQSAANLNVLIRTVTETLQNTKGECQFLCFKEPVKRFTKQVLINSYQSIKLSKTKFFSDQSEQFIFSLASIVAFHTHHLGNMSIANSTKKLLAQCDDFCLQSSIQTIYNRY